MGFAGDGAAGLPGGEAGSAPATNFDGSGKVCGRLKTMEAENKQASVIDVFFQPVVILRLFVLLLLTNLIALALGVAFVLITFGLFNGGYRLAQFWQPAYTFFVKVLRIPDAPAKLPPYRNHRWIPLATFLYAALTIGFIAWGVWWLSDKGFCGQNLFCGL